MKFRHLLLTTLILLSTSVLAQEKSYFSELVPPSPDVAQLGQYGATQVGKYTGTANVQVPLHSIDSDGLQIPIALSYQTGGIKVAQEASWVGLGWNLSANAVITREINGYDDLTDDGGAKGYLYSPVYEFGNLTPTQESALFNAYTTTPHDSEPDLFTANIFGESFQFVLPKKGMGNEVEAIVLNNKVVKVLYDDSNQSFKVINGQGFTFNFGSALNGGSKEYTTTYRSDGSSATTDATALSNSIAYQTSDSGRTWQKISAWHIDDVTAPSGRIIDFTYQTASYFGYPSFSENYDFDICTISSTQNGIGYVDYDADSIKKVSCSITGFQAVQLNQISGDFGTIDFTLTDRLDISNRYQTTGNNFQSVIPSGNPIKRLTGITVKNSLNQQIKAITLNQTYFNSDQSTDTGSYKKEKYMRLKLDSITINDQTYSFDYIQPNDVPAKDSKDEDFWGYYNGEANTSRLPSFGRIVLCNSNQKEYFFNLSGANKGANITFGKIGLLSKITYPTKGYTEFAYESNSALIDKPTSSGYSSPYSNSADLSYNYQYIKRSLTDGYRNNIGGIGDTFEITSASTLPFDKNLWATVNVICGQNCGGVPDNMQNVIEIEKLDNPGAGTIVGSIPYYDGSIGQVTESFNLSNGIYKINLPGYSAPSSGYQGLFGSLINAYFLDTPADTPFPWEEFDIGGARVESVTNRDADGSFIGKKEYSYDASNLGQIVSSGKLMNQLVYHSKYGFLDYTPQDFLQVFTMSSGSSVSLDFSAQGSHVGYGYVTEMDVSETGTAKGNTLTTYENIPNELLTYYVGTTPMNNHNNITNGGLSEIDVHYGNAYLIGVPPNSFSYRNGNVLWESLEDDSSNTLRRVDNTFYDYPLDTVKVYKAYFSPGGLVADFGYDQKGNKFLSNTVETKSYFGSDIVSTTVTNTYELQKYLPRSTTTTTSENSVAKKQETYYPFDTDYGIISEAHMADLVNLNRVTEPILIRTYENTSLLSQTKFKYGNFSGDYWRTEALEAKESDVLTQRMDFVSYDDLGNLTEYKQTDGAPVSYVWGYDQMYPVAKIQNATYSQVIATGVSLSILNNTTSTDAQRTTELNKIRNGLPNAMVTIFLYKPGVGITSSIDPRGYKTTYEYDTNNRPIKVKDANSDVVTDYDYHFKGQ